MAKTSVKTQKARAARTYQVLQIPDLSGGLDLRRSPTLLAPDRARVLMNYALSTPGEIVVRPGYTAFSTTLLGSSAYQGGQRVYLAANRFTLTAWGGNVYRPPDDGAQSSVVDYSTISDTAAVFFPYDRILVAVLDGVNRPYKSTGSTTWSRLGLDASTGKSTITSLSSGSLSASEFEVTFAYKDRGTGHLSNISTLVSTLTLGTTGAIHIDTPNSSDAQTDAIVIYARNKTAGEEVLRRASSYAAQGGASSTGRIESSAWSANDEAPTTRNPPAAHRFAAIWKNRWWAASSTVGNRLHFTEIFENQAWPTLYFIDIPFEKGDEITALIPQGDTLLVFGQNKVFLIIGQTSLDFEVRPSAGAQAGALGPRAVCQIENGVIHAAAEGVFIFDGASDKLLSYDIEPAWRDLVSNTTSADLGRIAVVYDFERKEVAFALPRLYPRAARGEFILDLNRTRETQTPAWTDTDRAIGVYVHWDGSEPNAGDRGRLLSLSPTEGRIFDERTGTTANSSNMTAEYEGPHLSLGLHRGRFIDLHGEYEPHGGNFSAEIVVDDVSQGAQSIAIGSGLSQYDTATYDVSVYAGAGRRKFHTMLPLSADGRTVWLKTAYQGQESFRQFTYAIGMVPESAVINFSE
jgi:hypothetical protein